MNSNGNTIAEKPLTSAFLRKMLAIKKVTPDIAQWADQFPTPELQSEAIHLLRDDQAQSKTRVEAVMREKLNPNPPPADSPKDEDGGFSLHAPTGRIGKAVKSIEKVAAWDMVGDLEEWMAVKVPPYRAARRVFSWLWMAFGAEAMLATLISCVMLYGAFLGVRWTYRRIMQGPAPSAQGPVTKPGGPLGTGNLALGPAVFQITSAQYGDGNRLELHWTSIGAGYTYRIFKNCHPEEGDVKPYDFAHHSITTPAARVNIAYDTDCPTPVVQVMPIAPSGAAEALSDPVVFHLSLLNNYDSVEPIAMEATQQTTAPSAQPPVPSPKKQAHKQIASTTRQETPSSVVNSQPVTNSQKPSFVGSLTKHLLNNADGVISSAIPIPSVGQGVIAAKNAAVTAHDETRQRSAPSAQAPATTSSSSLGTGNLALGPIIPVVVNLRGERVGNTVRMTWDAPGTNYKYNVYVAYDNEHPVFDTGNDKPVNGPVITWTPPADGVQVFVLYIRAVDAQGHEGPPSNRIIADLR